MRIRKFLAWSIIVVFILFSCKQESNSDYLQNDFPNVLSLTNIPKGALDRETNAFFDLGAWHGFALIPDSAIGHLGGFAGPFLMNEWSWLSKNLVQLTLHNAELNKKIDLEKGTVVKNEYLPGRLLHVLQINDLEIQLRLFFISARTAVINAVVINKRDKTLKLKTGWQGSLLLKETHISTRNNRIIINLENSESLIDVYFSNEMAISQLRGHAYLVEMSEYVDLEPGDSLQYSAAISYFENDEEAEEQSKYILEDLKNTKKIFQENSKRWQSYINQLLSVKSSWSSFPEYQNIAVKSLLTLANNWKSSLGDLKHDGLIPSYNINYFNGFWAWDSWKHAVALVQFEPQLAKDQVRAMFDFQNESGMVADCIYSDKSENNWRDTKPPLAAWAVWEIFKKTKEYGFVKEMYPALVKYHKWWYKDRDHNKNGLCEYGSTDGTIIAARWESGMDNAVRFDSTKMLKNNEYAWSMDQESVDLNSYLYAEKVYLSKMATVIKKPVESNIFIEEANELKRLIQSKMYDVQNGYFYDIKISDGSFIKVDGPEGWTPLWCEVASAQQAEQVKKVICDTSKFATYIPFPTVSKAHEQFSKGYWRGPVWLDQAYFAINGLYKYGFNNEAQQFTQQIFDRAEGLKNSPDPIRENYNPTTGKGMRVKHFSWSAAHLLLLYLEK